MLRIIFILSLGFSVLLSNDSYKGLYIVIGSVGKVRIAPTIKAREYKRFQTGDIVEIKDKVVDKEWYQLQNGFFIYTKVLKKISPKNVFEIKTTKISRLRSKPNLNQKTIIKDKINRGKKFYAIGVLKNWYILIDGSFIWKNHAVIQ